MCDSYEHLQPNLIRTAGKWPSLPEFWGKNTQYIIALGPFRKNPETMRILVRCGMCQNFGIDKRSKNQRHMCVGQFET